MSYYEELPLVVGFSKQWEMCSNRGQRYMVICEVKEEVQIYPCKGCKCLNIDCEDGLSCNLQEDSYIESFTTKLSDYPYGSGDDYVSGARQCPLVKIITTNGEKLPPNPITAFVVGRSSVQT